MARKLRLEYPGACYHVINRGNYRRDVFAPKGAAEAFERCLFEAAERFHWRLHAFVIMRNHFHLAVETPEPNLGEGMKWLQGTWAMRFNRFRGEAGRPFQGRYKALHVEPGHALAQVCHYIHLNPVRAKVLPVERARQFGRSSLAWFARKDRPAALEPATVLLESGGLADTTAGWRKYEDYLGVIAEEEGRLRQQKFGRLSRGWCVGSAAFQKTLKQDFVRLETAGTGEPVALEGPEARQAWRQERWEEQLAGVARKLKVDLSKLPSRKSAPDKVCLAAVMKTCTSASNAWLAARLKMGRPASVSQFVRRFRLAGLDRGAAFQGVLSTVKQ